MANLPEKMTERKDAEGSSARSAVDAPQPNPQACSVPENICVDIDGDGVYDKNHSPGEDFAASSEDGTPETNRETNGKNHKYYAQNYLQSQQFALTGLKLIYVNERNFKIQLVFTVLVIIAGFLFNLSHQDWVALALVIALVLVTEAFNSVIEAICDTISQDYRVNIKYAKDVSAGAVLLSAILALVAGVIIFSPYVWDLLVQNLSVYL